MSDRTPQDYAIEFGGYLALAVDYYFSVNAACPRSATEHQIEIAEARRGVLSAAYEFRKRAKRAKETQ